MVNVPPIPPLLCSTPPPIDFGEEDEDMDEMQSAISGVEDEEYGDYIDVPNKQNSFLSSGQSTSELPPVSIYDGLVDRADNVTPSDENKPRNIIEAYNYSIKTPPSEESCHETTSECKLSDTIQDQFKKIDCKKVSLPLPAIVSIEDLEDDLSEDELYSPKTPKNFVETDNISNYFVIEEIKQDHTNFSTINDSHKTDNCGLDHDKTKYNCDNDSETLNVLPLNDKVILPPPVNHDDPSDYNDFGDFADFQDYTNSSLAPSLQQNKNNLVPGNENNNLVIGGNEVNSTEVESRRSSLSTGNAAFDTNFNDFIYHSRDLDDENRNADNENQTENPRQEINSEESNESLSKATQENDTSDSVSADLSLDDDDDNKASNEYFESADDSFGEFEEPIATSMSKTKEDASFGEEEFNDTNSKVNYGQEQHKTQDLVEDSFGTFEKCSENKNAKQPIGDADDDDDFADFAQHEEFSNASSNESCPNIPNIIQTKVAVNIDDGDDDDDDDFGDFNTAEPQVVSQSITNISNPRVNSSQTSITPPINLNERISKILQLMFTSNESNPLTDAENATIPDTKKLQDIPFTSIDAAKALEYQWLNSETRHTFIKSLGIDSRNILYGENWNPSLPRFAANLSFNPLKPMKPQSSKMLSESTAGLEVCSETLRASHFSNKQERSTTVEQKLEASKDNETMINNDETLCVHTSFEPYKQTESLQQTYDAPAVDSEEDETQKYSKTPPISEMESVTTFAANIPQATLDSELTGYEVVSENAESINSLNVNDVVVATSTFSGSFKETHIYTPSKTNDFDTVQTSTTISPSKVKAIDFDYEKAAMGVIIDETVVKKEYRDVEYNPGFSLDSSVVVVVKSNKLETTIDSYEMLNMDNGQCTKNTREDVANLDESLTPELNEYEEGSDEFTEFQSVSTNESVKLPNQSNNIVQKSMISDAASVATTGAPVASHGGMILSPAILIPQAISMEANKPKIEWGDSTATINPEELARIEELFPEPKSLKSNAANVNSQKSTPTHKMHATPSISATIANKEFQGGSNASAVVEDDDWSDFVSVPAANNNNNFGKLSPATSPYPQRSPIVNKKSTLHLNQRSCNNDDEWSDFASAPPQPLQSNSLASAQASGQTPYQRVPQFNSAAWQNANFYNNPFSLYHKGPLNIPTSNANSSQQQYQPSPKHLHTNTNHNNNNNYGPFSSYQQSINNTSATSATLPQQIHVMQNFSTAPVPQPERLSMSNRINPQFQVAKVAPTIALIPDLGFVAPAIPSHTSFINSLPKPSINMKK